MYSVGKRACVEPLKNKIEILKTECNNEYYILLGLTNCNKDYYIKKSSDCIQISTI